LFNSSAVLMMGVPSVVNPFVFANAAKIGVHVMPSGLV
jgi:hypothetical protein